MAHGKSQDRDNFKWKLGFSHYCTFIHSTAEEMKKRWISLPGRPVCTQNSSQLHRVCQVPLGASWRCKKHKPTPTGKVNAFYITLLETRFTPYLSVVVIVVVGCPLVTERPAVALGAVTVEGAQRVDTLTAVPAAALLALVHILVTSAEAQNQKEIAICEFDGVDRHQSEMERSGKWRRPDSGRVWSRAQGK